MVTIPPIPWHFFLLIIALAFIAYRGVKSYKNNRAGGGALDLRFYSALPWLLLFSLITAIYGWMFW